MDDLQDIQAELGRIPAALFAQLRREAGLDDKDVISLTPDEKVNPLLYSSSIND